MSQEVPPDVEIPTLTQTLPGHLRTRPLEIPWITERAPKIDPGKPVPSPLALDSTHLPDSLDSTGSPQSSQASSQDHRDENAPEGQADQDEHGKSLAADATANALDASDRAQATSSSSLDSPSSPSSVQEPSGPDGQSMPAYASGGIQSAALQSQEADIARWVSQVIQATAQSKNTGEGSAQVPPPDALADEVVERVQARLNHMLPNLVQEVMDEIHQNPSPRGKPSDGVEMK